MPVDCCVRDEQVEVCVMERTREKRTIHKSFVDKKKLQTDVTEVDGMLKINNIATFQWYIAKTKSFNGTYPNMQSFNGT